MIAFLNLEAFPAEPGQSPRESFQCFHSLKPPAHPRNLPQSLHFHQIHQGFFVEFSLIPHPICDHAPPVFYFGSLRFAEDPFGRLFFGGGCFETYLNIIIIIDLIIE